MTLSASGTKVLLDAGVEDSLVLDSGVHQFSFQYQLPTNLPSTFSGVYGSVTYVAKVTLSSHDLLTPHREFSLVQFLDRLDRRGYMTDDSAEVLLQSFLQGPLQQHSVKLENLV